MLIGLSVRALPVNKERGKPLLDKHESQAYLLEPDQNLDLHQNPNPDQDPNPDLDLDQNPDLDQDTDQCPDQDLDLDLDLDQDLAYWFMESRAPQKGLLPKLSMLAIWIYQSLFQVLSQVSQEVLPFW